MSYSPKVFLAEILPDNLRDEIIKRDDVENLYEIRLILGAKVVLRTYQGSKRLGLSVKREDILEIVKRATDNSLYAYNDKILDGFIEYKGIRLGISGEIVRRGECVTEIKNFNALVIRLPHEVLGCSLSAFKRIISSGQVKNTMIFSPPGCGKTTYLRDISKNLSDFGQNVVVIDYKNELSASFSGGRLLDVGESLVISNSPRIWGLERAVRNLSPDVIVTDEIYSAEEYQFLERAIWSGVRVVASAHFYDVSEIPNIFDLYVGLSTVIGGEPCIYDKNKQKIFT